jgi:C4-dicarboxylate-specific signal transduction histidine kinase
MRASEVIRRIRDLLHKAPLERAPLNFNETVQEVLELVSSDLLRSKVKLQADPRPIFHQSWETGFNCSRVILNLILNARDTMSEESTHSRELLLTSGKNESGDVIVSVQDSGKGLDAKDSERIFDPFFTTKAEGMGLGLSISRRIVEDHRGRMWSIPNGASGAP